MKDKLEQALRGAWSRRTAYPGTAEKWTPELPEYGQCAVTSLVVQDYLGGIIMYSSKNHHFYNLIDGRVVDYTIRQFSDALDLSDSQEATRRTMLFGERAERAATQARYSELLFAVGISLRFEESQERR